jgi:hypothetical protein
MTDHENDHEPAKPPWVKKRRNERDDDTPEHVTHTRSGGPDDRSDRRYRWSDPDELIDSPEKQVEIAYHEGRPDWRKQWDEWHSPEQMRRNRFINRIWRELEKLATFDVKIRQIRSVAPEVYDEVWALLTIRTLREIRESSEQAMRRIITEMVSNNIITPQAASKASGYSRTSIYNWLKEVTNDESEPPRQ